MQDKDNTDELAKPQLGSQCSLSKAMIQVIFAICWTVLHLLFISIFICFCFCWCFTSKSTIFQSCRNAFCFFLGWTSTNQSNMSVLLRTQHSAPSELWTSDPLVPSLILYQLSHCAPKINTTKRQQKSLFIGFVIISLGRENWLLYFCCVAVAILWLFLGVPWVGL